MTKLFYYFLLILPITISSAKAHIVYCTICGSGLVGCDTSKAANSNPFSWSPERAFSFHHYKFVVTTSSNAQKQLQSTLKLYYQEGFEKPRLIETIKATATPSDSVLTLALDNYRQYSFTCKVALEESDLGE